MVTTHIVIPVRDHVELTKSMVEQLKLQSGWEKCWIFDNGSVDNTWEYLLDVHESDKRFHPIQAPGAGIHDMWDNGVWLAKEHNADHIAIFNNDITLFPNTLTTLNTALEENRDAWIAYPDYDAIEPGPISYKVTTGTRRHGGMSGFCFMLKAGYIYWTPLVDEQFKWWGGDDDIAFIVEASTGLQIRVLGLPVAHIGEGTAHSYDLGAQKAADFAAIIAKWGR